MAKLPKWAIRQAGGINKKAWALARRGRRRKTTTTRRRPVRRTRRTYRRTYTKKVVRRTARGKLFTKTMRDGMISAGGKTVIRKVYGTNPLIEAGLDIALGYVLHNKTLMGQGVVNGALSFLPGLNLGGKQ